MVPEFFPTRIYLRMRVCNARVKLCASAVGWGWVLSAEGKYKVNKKTHRRDLYGGLKHDERTRVRSRRIAAPVFLRPYPATFVDDFSLTPRGCRNRSRLRLRPPPSQTVNARTAGSVSHRFFCTYTRHTRQLPHALARAPQTPARTLTPASLFCAPPYRGGGVSAMVTPRPLHGRTAVGRSGVSA